MGIDPITHEPLNKQASSNDTSSPAENLSQPDNKHEVKETVVNSEENSSSPPTENSSGEESLLLDSLCSDDSLMNSLWLDETPLVEALWEMDITPIAKTETEHTKTEMNSVPTWEDNCAWLLDCQDFGIHDFGFNYFNEIETLGTKENQH